ncbi:MAG: hypothetical protein V3T62_04170, partial [Alphaproteobacteria bacterium]
SGAGLAARALDDFVLNYHYSNSPPFPQAEAVAALVARHGFDKAATKPLAPLYLREPGIGPIIQGREGA